MKPGTRARVLSKARMLSGLGYEKKHGRAPAAAGSYRCCFPGEGPLIALS